MKYRNTNTISLDSIKNITSVINTGAFSCNEVFVITFSFLTRWLRNFVKNNRYHSAIVRNKSISLTVNIS